MKTYVSFRETVSKNYQSETQEFGMEVEVGKGRTEFEKVKRAQTLCKAVVRSALGKKIGLRRHELDDLSDEFFGVSWQELDTGVSKGDEVL